MPHRMTKITMSQIIDAAVKKNIPFLSIITYQISVGRKNRANALVVVDFFDKTIDFTIHPLLNSEKEGYVDILVVT